MKIVGIYYVTQLVHEYGHKASCTWMRLEVQKLRAKAHSQVEVESVVIEEDQDTVHLGL